jgi:hypothetical protein
MRIKRSPQSPHFSNPKTVPDHPKSLATRPTPETEPQHREDRPNPTAPGLKDKSETLSLDQKAPNVYRFDLARGQGHMSNEIQSETGDRRDGRVA